MRRRYSTGFPDASLARVYLFYPDPWPKRRHRKRRFVSPENLSKLARVMTRGAELRFATDIDDYAGWTLARLRGRDDFSWTARSAKDWLHSLGRLDAAPNMKARRWPQAANRSI